MVITRYLRHVARGAIGEKRLASTTANTRPQTAGRRLVADELTRLAPLKKGPVDAPKPEEGVTTIGKRIMSAGYNNLRRRSSKGGGDTKVDVEAGISAGAGVEAVQGPVEGESKEKERKVEFTVTKCKILATMLRFGVALEKVKALAYFGTVRYVK
jgi:hypothetical protein